MSTGRVRIAVAAMACLVAYETARACTCMSLIPDPDDAQLVVEVDGGGMGCGAQRTRRVTIESVTQDPLSEFAVGDRLRMEFNEGPGASCGVDVARGNRFSVVFPAGTRPTVGLCNSFRVDLP